MNPHGLFITGTDTGVGKTIVTALLLAYLRQQGQRAVALKPISSGDRRDGRLLWMLARREIPLATVNPVHFRLPLAPAVAARLERRAGWRPSRLPGLIRRVSRPIVLVEGVGGLLVPLAPGYTCRELARDVGFPLLIVARPGLGTLNHTALTVEAARASRLEIRGVVLNHARPGGIGLAERTNRAALETFFGVKVIGEIPCVGGLRPTAESVRAALENPSVRQSVAELATGCFGEGEMMAGG